MFILKRFEKIDVIKMACQKEKRQQNFIESGTLEPKNSRDEKLWSWDYFLKKLGIWKIIKKNEI